VNDGAKRPRVNDKEVVADASAILALVFGEPFERFDPDEIVGAFISTVNRSEVLAKLLEKGLSEAEADEALGALGLRIVAFGEMQARTAARLRSLTRHASLSLGDRACLALGLELKRPVVTADRPWNDLGIGVEVMVIR
jgi:PIN domain nuclease of toxin-antitoxin system